MQITIKGTALLWWIRTLFLNYGLSETPVPKPKNKFFIFLKPVLTNKYISDRMKENGKNIR